MIDTTLPEYLDAARGWEADTILRAKRSERRAWWVAACAGALAVVCAGAVVALTPLKTVELRVVRVDKNTGYTDVVSEVTDNHLQYEDVKDQYWVSQYVETRERYSNEVTGNDYVKIGLLSAPDVGSQYAAQMDPRNKTSPLSVFGRTGKVDIHIISVSLLGNGVASVRYTRSERSGGIDTPASNWIATVAYRYTDMKLKDEERRINPVGFQVTDYRRSTESVAVAPASR